MPKGSKYDKSAILAFRLMALPPSQLNPRALPALHAFMA
jgi:hypothetical protein